MTQSLPPEWTETLSLSRRQAPELYQAADEIEPGPHAEAIRFALVELGLAAVFCIEGAPTIGFLHGSGVTPARIDDIHRILWNQGLMSLLLVMGDDELSAYSLVQKPLAKKPFEYGPDDKSDPRLIAAFSRAADALELRELIRSTESGRFWHENEAFFDPSQRVDSVLLSNLIQSFRDIKDDLGGEATQALLMQAMFIAYLEDRKILNEDVIRKASSQKSSTFAALLELQDPDAFEKLFAWLKKGFNGNVFNAPCAFESGDAEPPRIQPRHLQVLARFRHGQEDMDSGQYRFWGYDFQYIPIALISAVYDRFLNEEADKKKAQGAFYTPMFLADMAVNQLWDELTDQQRATGTFYDPACGSGVFLVRIFQRLVAHHCDATAKTHASWNELTAIALRLHGGDINASAVRVAAFSLYIALLEHSDPPDLQTLLRKGGLLPGLYGDTLRPAEDFFSTPGVEPYDAVIGNPPWKGRAGQVTTAQEWVKAHKLPYPAQEIAWGFVWKALKVLKPGGVIGFLLPAMGVLHNTAQITQEARRRLFQEGRVRRIINLSDLCFQLFDGAQRPTAFLLYGHADDSDAPYRFEYWTPKADLNLRLKRLLTLTRSDRIRIRSDHVDRDPSIFKRRLWGRSPDEKLLQYLGAMPPLASLVHQYKHLGAGYDRSTMWAIGQGFIPAQSDRIGKKGYKTTSAHSVKRFPYLAASSFQPLILPDINAKPWPVDIVYRTGFEQSFIGPHILIPQGLSRSVGRARAAYTEQNLVFQDSLQAIVFPPAENAKAKLLTAILNSRFAAWFYFHNTSNFGTDRAKIHQEELLKLPFPSARQMFDLERSEKLAKNIVAILDNEIKKANSLLRGNDDVLEEIDSLVYEYYGLDAHDIALIEDTFEYIIPAIQPRRSAGLPAIWKRSRPEQRRAYAEMLCDALMPWLDDPLGAALVAKSADVAVLRLTLGGGGAASAYREEETSDLEGILAKISAHLPEPLPGNAQIVPDLHVIIGREMYLVKPIQLRYWLRSTALADAEQIAAEFCALAARSPMDGSGDRPPRGGANLEPDADDFHIENKGSA